MKSKLIIILMILLALLASCTSFDEPCNCDVPLSKSKLLLLNDTATIKDVSMSTRNPNGLNVDTFPHASIYYWTFTGVLGIAEACFKFDLSEIKPTAKIKNATLTLYDVENTFYYSNTSDTVFLFKIIEPWTPSVTNWNNKPEYNIADSIFVPEDLNALNGYSQYNITRFVEDWVKTPTQNHGMLMQLADLWLYHGFDFYLSDCPDVSLRPKLEIEYED